jgi:hypothetical protein
MRTFKGEQRDSSRRSAIVRNPRRTYPAQSPKYAIPISFGDVAQAEQRSGCTGRSASAPHSQDGPAKARVKSRVCPARVRRVSARYRVKRCPQPLTPGRSHNNAHRADAPAIGSGQFHATYNQCIRCFHKRHMYTASENV